MNLHDFGLGFLGTPESSNDNRKVDKLDFMKTKTYVLQKAPTRNERKYLQIA